jgi:hypothetical protein
MRATMAQTTVNAVMVQKKVKPPRPRVGLRAVRALGLKSTIVTDASSRRAGS